MFFCKNQQSLHGIGCFAVQCLVLGKDHKGEGEVLSQASTDRRSWWERGMEGMGVEGEHQLAGEEEHLPLNGAQAFCSHVQCLGLSVPLRLRVRKHSI